MLLKYLKDQGGQFWGAFAQSYANAVEKAKDRPLKEAMMKAEIGHYNAVNAKLEMDMQTAKNRATAMAQLQAALTPHDVTTSQDIPATDEGTGATVTQTRHDVTATPAQLEPLYAAAAPGEYIKSKLEPKPLQHIPPGSMVPDPNNPGQLMQVGQPIETQYQKDTIEQRKNAAEQATADRAAQREISQGHLDVSKRLATVAEQNANTKAASKSKDLASMSDKDLELAYNRAIKTEQAIQPGALHQFNPFASGDQDQRYAEAKSDREALQGEMKRRRGGAQTRITSPTGKSKEERLKGLGF